MNADAFRYLYEYHFSENRKVWEKFIAPLSQEQFTQGAGYSHGSVRNQIVHIMNVDDGWFAELRGVDNPDILADEVDDRGLIQEHWGRVEQDMRAYLATLQDEMLFSKPIINPEEDRFLMVWQVLIHVVNHATDHRAQLLRLLNDLGVKTEPQDFIFFIDDYK